MTQENLPPNVLELEITENIILQQDETMLATLRELNQLGVGVALDDYGTGYASLTHLKRYPLTRLKIDQSFVRSAATNREDKAIVRAIAYLGKTFGLETTAEGVETPELHAMVCNKGCNEAQGYLYGKPMPAEAFGRQFITRGMVAAQRERAAI